MASISRSSLPASLFVLSLLLPAAPLAAAGQLAGAGLVPGSAAETPASLLGGIRPDYPRYIGSFRPLTEAMLHGVEARRIYMALVRPGAPDPVSPQSAPFAGAGVQNDILYDRGSIDGERSAGWSLLLLDHEYFHARHLAGATSLPLPETASPEIERHYYEAAAWGFNVAEARSGRYPGLRADEFREALDHYGEHYAALRSLMQESQPAVWESYVDLLRRPSLLITMTGSSPSRALGRPSGWGRAPAIP